MSGACTLRSRVARKPRIILSSVWPTALGLGAVFACVLALAQEQGPELPPEIVRFTIDNGGGTVTGGNYSLIGTIGQHDAETQVSAGGEFSLAGGFWAKAQASVGEFIFKNGFETQ